MKKELEKAILQQIGISKKEFKSRVSDFQNASGGIRGFVYYSDTHEFTMDNQSSIVDLLEETAEQLGEDVVSMVSNFRIFKGNMDKDEKKDLYAFLSGNKNIEQGSVTNILAWFCVEQLAFELDN